jgi:ATP-dependent helicase HepA
MLEQAAALAEQQARTLRQTALKEMNHLLGHEAQRLQTLRQLNDHIRPEEIELAIAQQAELAIAVQQARVRLESLRLIWKGPPEVLN